LKKGKKKIKMILGEEDFVRRVEDETKEEKLFFALFFTFAYLSVAKGGKEQNVL